MGSDAIEKRWRYWAPFARFWFGGERVEEFRIKHRDVVTAMLRAGLDLRSIKRNRLDNPQLSREDREGLVKQVTK